MNLKSPILKEVHVGGDIHFSHLFTWINGAFRIDKHQIDELEKQLAYSVEEAKTTGNPVLINAWCGEFDLLVTSSRIHVILIHKTFELPEIEQEDSYGESGSIG